MLVFLGLGCNKKFNSHSCVETLELACSRLGNLLSGMQVSSIYKTAAMYVTDQDDFYNMAVCGFYEGTPRQLLIEINSIEAEYGRNRDLEIRNGPRSLDIDIELFGNLKINEPDLIIPHERMEERSFVLVPVLELINKNAEILKGNSIPFSAEYLQQKLISLKDQRIELLNRK